MVQKERLQCKSLHSFFGLQPNDKKQIYEEIFQLIYYGKGGFTFDEAYNLPIHMRRFYLQRLTKQYADEQKEVEKQQKAAQSKIKRK